MLTGLGLENFQTFSTAQFARLAPITLIFGPNSSGKSSIIRALRFLAANIKASNTASFGDLKFNGDSVNLESYENAVHKHDPDLQMKLTLEVRNSPKVDPGFYDEGSPPKGRLSSTEIRRTLFTFASVTTSQNPQSSQIQNLELHGLRPSRTGELEDSYRLCLERDSEDTGTFKIFNTPTSNVLDLVESYQYQVGLKKDDEPWKIERFVPFFDSRPELEAAVQQAKTLTNIYFLLNALIPVCKVNPDEYEEEEAFGEYETSAITAAALDDFFKENLSLLDESMDCEYVGPLREIPEIISRNSIDKPIELNLGTTETQEEIIQNPSPTEQKPRYWFNELTGGRFTWKSAPLTLDGINLNLFGNLIVDNRSGTKVSFSDVGVGLSQIIPVIKTSFDNSSRLKFVEQPELHLHPRMQSDLGDMFIDAAGLTGDHPKSQFIIETHSENLILRIQRRIREQVIRAEDVSILYVDYPENSPSTIREIRLNDEGDFVDSWPQSFVDLRLDDLL